jgi:transposase
MSTKKVICTGSQISLGIDVDSKTSFVVALDTQNGEIVDERRMNHDSSTWKNYLDHFENCKIWGCYEAGGTGFGLYRILVSLGVDCQVIAPTKVAKSAENMVIKNDRQDAVMLANLFFHPPQRFVRVPSVQEENDRELIRTREQLIRTQICLKNRIKAKLRFHSISSSQNLGRDWSQQYCDWIRDCAKSTYSLWFCLNRLLDQLENVIEQIRSITRAIRELSKTEAYKENCERLCQIRGVGPLTAMAFLLEVFRPEDFQTPGQLASHLGFAPRQYSSGKNNRLGHITRWGPSHLRRYLVEATWIWTSKDPQARKRFESLKAGKLTKIAAVAMARRLAIIMWAMTVKAEDYNYRWAA